MTQSELVKSSEAPLRATPAGKKPDGNMPQVAAQGTPGQVIPESAVVPIKDTTRRTYETIVRAMIRFSTNKRSLDPLEPAIVSPLNMVEDLWERRDNGLESSTFSTYRSALIWHLAQHRGSRPYEEAWILLQELSETAAGVSTQHVKRRKSIAKTIPENDLHLLVEELTAKSVPRQAGGSGPSRTRWSYRACYWLLAGLATGLRPIEWASARWANEEHTLLLVTNAKVKLQGPAFMREQRSGQSLNAVTDPVSEDLDEELQEEPVEREIPVTSSRERFNIETHMRLLEQWLAEGKTFEQYFQASRRVVWRACRKLWGGRKLYSLYTMRSQYSANTRARVGPVKTAELMGHTRADSPSAAHYGKANQAHAAYRRQPGTNPPVAEGMIPAATPAGPDAPAATPAP